MNRRRFDHDISQPLHGNAIEVDGRGIVITGPSKAGKTTFSIQIIQHAKARGLSAHFIADDQIYLEINHDLILTAPKPLHNMLALRGHGIISNGLPFMETVKGSLWIELKPDGPIDAIQQDNAIYVNGYRLDYREIVSGDWALGVMVVMAALGQSIIG